MSATTTLAGYERPGSNTTPGFPPRRRSPCGLARTQVSPENRPREPVDARWDVDRDRGAVPTRPGLPRRRTRRRPPSAPRNPVPNIASTATWASASAHVNASVRPNPVGGLRTHGSAAPARPARPATSPSPPLLPLPHTSTTRCPVRHRPRPARTSQATARPARVHEHRRPGCRRRSCAESASFIASGVRTGSIRAPRAEGEHHRHRGGVGVRERELPGPAPPRSAASVAATPLQCEQRRAGVVAHHLEQARNGNNAEAGTQRLHGRPLGAEPGGEAVHRIVLAERVLLLAHGEEPIGQADTTAHQRLPEPFDLHQIGAEGRGSRAPRSSRAVHLRALIRERSCPDRPALVPTSAPAIGEDVDRLGEQVDHVEPGQAAVVERRRWSR